jgi:hypothetical protein
MDALTALPSSFAAGTTVKYTRNLADRPANGGWALELVISGRSRLAVNATPSGADFAITLPATETAKLGAGLYRWAERASKAGEVFTVGEGSVNVTPDVVAAPVGELQSPDEKELELVIAAIEKRLPADLEAFQIAGRSVNKIPMAELWKRRAVLESRIARAKNGGELGRRHLVSFPRVP